MRTLRHSAFVAAKTAAPIPVAHRLVRDALVQAALDPAVRTIGHVPSVPVCGQVVPVDAIVLGGDDGRRLLDIVDARPLRSIDDEGLWLLAVERLGLPVTTLAGDLFATSPTSGAERSGDRTRTRRV